MSPLSVLKKGEKAEIVGWAGTIKTQSGQNREIADAGCGGNCDNCQCRGRSAAPIIDNERRVEAMGLRPGKQVEVVNNSGTGPLILRIEEGRIAMGRGAAMKIYVRRIVP